jgi:[methyl-Co(III) methanol-specific corrinoid protein]:coenzyme M methyltransferase
MSISREDVLNLFAGHSLGRIAVFSGLPSLTSAGLAAAGVRYATAHTDATQMAAAAASTFELFGFESAVVPFDLCVEAEAMGAPIDFQDNVAAFLAPVVTKPFEPDVQTKDWPGLGRLDQAGRVPLVAEAIGLLKSGVGRFVAVGAWIPGPFTLSWQLFGAEGWLTALAEAEGVDLWLEAVGAALTRVARRYREAGADFITVHEMGGSPQVIGPASFRRWVKPALAGLFAAMPVPAVLSVCGDTNAVVGDLVECGPGAINVDQRNNLARTRPIVGRRALLFGNLDPVGVLSQGSPETVAQTVMEIIATGADAVWPGCDLWPEVPEANFRALMEAALGPAANGQSVKPA